MNYRIPLVFLLGALAGAGATRIFREEPDKSGGETKAGPVQAAMRAGRPESPGQRVSAAPGGNDILKTATFRDFGAAGPSEEDFREIMFRLPGIQRSMAFSNLLAQLTPETAPAVLKLISGNAGKYDLHREHEMLWERWGQIDGRAACAAVFENNARFAQTSISQRTIKAWAREDPRSAYTWLMAQEDIPLRSGMIKGVIEGYAAADPEGAHRFIATELQDAALKNHGYWRVARSYLDAGGLPAVESYFAKFDKADPDYAGVRVTVADMFVDSGSAGALQWIGRQEAGAQSELSGYITSRLVHDRPDDLIRTLAADNTMTGFDRAGAISQGVAEWIRVNPNAMGEWLKKNPQLPHYDEVVVPFVNRIRTVDPEAAAAWTATIKDPLLRRQAESPGGN